MRPVQLYLLLIGVHLGQLLWYAPRLPAIVPSHFDASGTPDGWMAKGAFLTLLAVLTLLLLGTFAITANLVRRVPVALINLPNKDYWMAPERAGESRRTVIRELFKIAAATQVLVIVITQLSVDVALERREGLGSASWIALALYLAFTAWWLVALFRRFRRPDGSGTEGTPAASSVEPS